MKEEKVKESINEQIEEHNPNEVARINKSTFKDIVIQRSVVQMKTGKLKGIDIREWSKAPYYTGWTKKGVWVPEVMVEKLIKGLWKCLDDAERELLLDELKDYGRMY